MSEFPKRDEDALLVDRGGRYDRQEIVSVELQRVIEKTQQRIREAFNPAHLSKRNNKNRERQKVD